MESEETTMSAGKSRAPFTTIEEAIEEIRRGRMVVVCDDEDRENEVKADIRRGFEGQLTAKVERVHALLED